MSNNFHIPKAHREIFAPVYQLGLKPHLSKFNNGSHCLYDLGGLGTQRLPYRIKGGKTFRNYRKEVERKVDQWLNG